MNLPCCGEEILTKAAELSGIPESILRRYDGSSIAAAYGLTADRALSRCSRNEGRNWGYAKA